MSIPEEFKLVVLGSGEAGKSQPRQFVPGRGIPDKLKSDAPAGAEKSSGPKRR